MFNLISHYDQSIPLDIIRHRYWCHNCDCFGHIYGDWHIVDWYRLENIIHCVRRFPR